MTTCGEIRIALGVYVLGAIEPAERSQVEAHLAGCPACRDELAGLAALPALLSRVSEAQITQVAGDSAEKRSSSGDLLENLLARAARERRGMRRAVGRWGGLMGRWTPFAAVASILLVVGAVFGTIVLDDAPAKPPVASAPPTSPALPTGPAPADPAAERITATDSGSRVWAQLVLTRKKWGTYAVVHLKGVKKGVRCRLNAVTTDGRRDAMASWRVVYEEYGEFTGSTMYQRDQVKSFEIVTGEGKPLLTIPASS